MLGREKGFARNTTSSQRKRGFAAKEAALQLPYPPQDAVPQVHGRDHRRMLAQPRDRVYGIGSTDLGEGSRRAPLEKAGQQ